eukprot:3754217-Lingulodinium_polyedra.AAC.1
MRRAWLNRAGPDDPALVMRWRCRARVPTAVVCFTSRGGLQPLSGSCLMQRLRAAAFLRVRRASSHQLCPL